MSKKHLYIALTALVLITILAVAWWGWSTIGLAALELDMGVC